MNPRPSTSPGPSTATSPSLVARDPPAPPDLLSPPQRATSPTGRRSMHSGHPHSHPLSPPSRTASTSPPPRSPSLAPARFPATGDELDAEIELERTLSHAETRNSRDGRPPSRARSPTIAEEDEPSDGTTTATSEAKDGSAAEAQREPDIYDRFSPHRKHIMIAIVSFSGFLGPVASSAFLPSITVMADELNTTPEMINYTVAIFIVTIGIAPLFWSPLAGFYGRKPIYLLSMPIMTVASIGVANSKTIGQIIGTRILQGIGSSAVLAVGAGTVGDLYRPTERANAMSWFYSGIVMGPAFSPVLAGLFTEYTAITWRATQYFLCAASALSVGLTAAFLPETSHPPLPHTRIKAERGKKFVPFWFNPIQSVLLMRYPNIALATFTSCLVMIELYCIMIPLSTIFKERYNLTNVALAGCIYLAHGVGTLLGARIVGPYADRIVRSWIEKRGYRKPEDRLRAALIGTALVLPLSCFAYGWLLHFNKGGLAPPIVFLVINGVGTPMFFTPLNTYLVDALQKRSAEAIAVNNFFRYLFAAAASAFVLPMINAVGLGWTMTIGVVCCWFALGLILATMRWGEAWREAAAVHFKEVPDAEDGARHMPQVEEKADVECIEGDVASGGRAGKATEKEKEKEASRRPSAGSDHEHHDERHEEPGHLPTAIKRSRTRGNTVGGGGLARASSRQSTKSLPTVGEVLQRTVSISGASVHGG
ncbi:MFS general substrate transporter [Cutaneotrichosporon oleaginosum]|uniref:MFS general substrate transporter n=1 Tax=Cutaneotrichosporon oleaginosum TaxID=879819 RepID=A0A0J1BAK1_9TREE|nr:MFS general substrate transporter [Cutaneotrichosporon oleaginosum]KLT44929.1 MFS general substrate transporter [Cutaneotrichosporon oleaginosum]TXT12057.1 hypothetical protein COLE_02467 [Cutaneotrichosporon oleaginosum]